MNQLKVLAFASYCIFDETIAVSDVREVDVQLLLAPRAVLLSLALLRGQLFKNCVHDLDSRLVDRKGAHVDRAPQVLHSVDFPWSQVI